MFSQRYASLLIVLVLGAVSIVATACSNDSGSTANAGSSSETELPITVTSSGYSITLEHVELTEQSSVFDFQIATATEDQEPSLDRYLPFTPADIKTEGLSIADSTLGSYQPVLADDGSSVTAVKVAFEFDAIKDPSSDVSILFSRLSFSSASEGGTEEQVDGEWRFTIDPRELIDAGLRNVDIDSFAQQQGVTFTVERVAFYTNRTLVDFTIGTSHEDRIEMSGIVAQAGDGELTMVKTVAAHDDGSYTAEFPAFPPDAQLTLSLAPLLQEVHQPASVTIPIPDQAADAKNSASSVAVQQRFGFAGEQLIVGDLSFGPDSFTIRVDNAMPDHSGTVLLHFPLGGAGVRLVDNLGNTYQLVGASTNFRKDSLLSMWADGSSFTFAKTIVDGASSLTLSVASHGKQLRGPWQVTIPAPQ